MFSGSFELFKFKGSWWGPDTGSASNPLSSELSWPQDDHFLKIIPLVWWGSCSFAISNSLLGFSGLFLWRKNFIETSPSFWEETMFREWKVERLPITGPFNQEEAAWLLGGPHAKSSRWNSWTHFRKLLGLLWWVSRIRWGKSTLEAGGTPQILLTVGPWAMLFFLAWECGESVATQTIRINHGHSQDSDHKNHGGSRDWSPTNHSRGQDWGYISTSHLFSVILPWEEENIFRAPSPCDCK